MLQRSAPALVGELFPAATVKGPGPESALVHARRIENWKIKVRLPRWDDRTPNQDVIEGKGVPPKVRVETKEADFTERADPVLEKALATLRAQPEAERKAGKRR